jgi:hypothetical protein
MEQRFCFECIQVCMNIAAQLAYCETCRTMGPRSSGLTGDYLGQLEPNFKLSDEFSQGPSFSNSIKIEKKK